MYICCGTHCFPVLVTTYKLPSQDPGNKNILRPFFSLSVITIIQCDFIEHAGNSLEFKGCSSGRVERDRELLFWSIFSAQSLSHT